MVDGRHPGINCNFATGEIHTCHEGGNELLPIFLLLQKQRIMLMQVIQAGLGLGHLLFELVEFFFLILPNYLPPANRYNNSHQSHANEDLNMYSNVLDIINHFVPAANH